MRSKAAFSLLACLACAACLPVDDRPPPGILTVNVTSDDSLGPERKAFETEDGWTISFESFVMSIGYTRLGLSDACSDYAGSVFGPGRGYNRLLDLNAAEVQRISSIRLIGTCSFGFWNREPEDDSVLGEGVTEELRDELLEKKDDLFTDQLGTTLYVQGEATRGEDRKTFEWSFRQGIRRQNCEVETEAGLERGIRLESDERRTYELFTDAKSLFQAAPDDASLAFAPIASADDEYGDGDGKVTLDELQLVPVDPAWIEGVGRPDTDLATYAAYVYLMRVPALVHFRGNGHCTVAQALDEGMERILRRQEQQ